jgi:hypothetical protein
MTTLSVSEIEAFLQDMKAGKKLILAGEGDPDPYGGGAHWDYEMQYNTETQLYVLKINFYASQYNSEPEVSYQEFDEEATKKRLASEIKHRVSCW